MTSRFGHVLLGDTYTTQVIICNGRHVVVRQVIKQRKITHFIEKQVFAGFFFLSIFSRLRILRVVFLM